MMAFQNSVIALAGIMVSCCVNGEAVQSSEQCDYASTARRFMEGLENCSADLRLPVCFPEMSEIATALFEPDVIEVNFRVYEVIDGRKYPLDKGEIWFSMGDLFVRRQDRDAINYATVGGNLYEWRHAASSGEILSRYCGDTTEYLFYLVDTNQFKASVYDGYRRRPQIHNVVPTEDGSLAKLSEKEGAWAAVEIQYDPFWLRSLHFWSFNVRGEFQVMEFDRPKIRDEIPSEIRRLPEIDFKENGATLEERIKYL